MISTGFLKIIYIAPPDKVFTNYSDEAIWNQINERLYSGDANSWALARYLINKGDVAGYQWMCEIYNFMVEPYGNPVVAKIIGEEGFKKIGQNTKIVDLIYLYQNLAEAYFVLGIYFNGMDKKAYKLAKSAIDLNSLSTFEIKARSAEDSLRILNAIDLLNGKYDEVYNRSLQHINSNGLHFNGWLGVFFSSLYAHKKDKLAEVIDAAQKVLQILKTKAATPDSEQEDYRNYYDLFSSICNVFNVFYYIETKNFDKAKEAYEMLKKDDIKFDPENGIYSQYYTFYAAAYYCYATGDITSAIDYMIKLFSIPTLTFPETYYEPGILKLAKELKIDIKKIRDFDKDIESWKNKFWPVDRKKYKPLFDKELKNLLKYKRTW